MLNTLDKKFEELDASYIQEEAEINYVNSKREKRLQTEFSKERSF